MQDAIRRTPYMGSFTNHAAAFRVAKDCFATGRSRSIYRIMHCRTSVLLPNANVVCEGYVFTGVCLSTGGSASVHAGRPPCQGNPPLSGRPPPPSVRETPLARETPHQGDPLPGRHPIRETPPCHSCVKIVIMHIFSRASRARLI